MERNTNNKGLIWLIVILMILVFGLIGYIVYDKVLLNNKKVDKNDSIPTTTQNIQNNIIEENILRRDNFIYELNNEEYHISYNYKYITSDKYYENDEQFDEEAEKLAKDNNEYVYNMVYLEILLNDKKIDKIEIPIYYDYENSSEKDLINKIHFLSSDTINTLKGDDSEYLVFTIEYKHPYVDGSVNPIIVNKSGNVIHTIKFQDNTGWRTTDESSIMYDKGEYYLTNDTLYYLMPNCEQTNADGEYFDQYSLKVGNDKVAIEKQGTYKGAVAGGAICEE